MALAVVSPFASLGSVFQTSGWGWTLESLVESRLNITNARPASVLSVRAILLNQSPDFHLRGSDINDYISSLFQNGDCEWHCEDHKELGRLNGLAKSSIAITLQHENRYSDDPTREPVIRNICLKLVGLHHWKNTYFRIVPAWQPLPLSDVDKIFGSCLILGQLQEFSKFLSNSPKDEQKGDLAIADWADHVMKLILRFVESFGGFVSTLTDDEFIRIYMYDKRNQSPKLQALLEILRRLGRAIETNSKYALEQILEDLKKVATKEKVELIQLTMIPLVKGNRDLIGVLERLDTKGSSAIEIEYLVQATRGIVAGSFPFNGAVTALSKDITASRDNAIWTSAGATGMGFALTLVNPLVALIPLGVSGFYSYKAYRKEDELDSVQGFAAFEKELNIMGSAGRIYLLIIMSKAARFFPPQKKGPQYETYQRFMWENFQADVANPRFEVNAFIKKLGMDLHRKLSTSENNFAKYAETYGVDHLGENWQL